jgi:putative spermidine/putrescine transport system permease protein
MTLTFTRRLLYLFPPLLTVLVVVFIFGPIILSVIAGLTVNFQVGLSSGLTLRWLEQVLDLYSETIYLSLLIAFACLIVTMVIGVPTAYVLAKSKGILGRLVEEFLVLPIAIPGLALALGLIIAYGSVGELRRSWVFILIGHVIYTMPFMVRSVLAVLNSIDFEMLEEGAASLGANFYQRFFGVVIPNCRQGIIAGALMTFTLSVSEFNMTFLLRTPFTTTLPVGLADAYASMRLEIGSAYTIVFFFLIAPVLLLIQYFATNPFPRKRKKGLGLRLEASHRETE